jgi:hypothetical protein
MEKRGIRELRELHEGTFSFAQFAEFAEKSSLGRGFEQAHFGLTGWAGRGRLARMARKLRLQYPGAIYQVMSRRDRRERVFLDDADFCLFALKGIGKRLAMGS